jgi:hypothetical protein
MADTGGKRQSVKISRSKFTPCFNFLCLNMDNRRSQNDRTKMIELSGIFLGSSHDSVVFSLFFSFYYPIGRMFITKPVNILVC